MSREMSSQGLGAEAWEDENNLENLRQINVRLEGASPKIREEAEQHYLREHKTFGVSSSELSNWSSNISDFATGRLKYERYKSWTKEELEELHFVLIGEVVQN